MWIVFALILLAVVAIAFLPALKGYRTIFKEAAVGIVGVLVPLLTQVFDSLQGLDWRTYVLAGDRKNLTVLAILAALAVVGAILRFKTTGAVGEK